MVSGGFDVDGGGFVLEVDRLTITSGASPCPIHWDRKIIFNGIYIYIYNILYIYIWIC